MKPASPVIAGAPEIVIAKDQPEYIPLPAIVLDGPERKIVTRWELDDEDRARLAAGGSVYLSVWTFGAHLQPIELTTIEPQLQMLTPDGVKALGGGA